MDTTTIILAVTGGVLLVLYLVRRNARVNLED
jgi:hypothetical protein